MTLTACSLFTSYLLWRVYEINMENVRYGEQVAASKGEDVSSFSASPRLVSHAESLADRTSHRWPQRRLQEELR
jgi:hypothetical protein